MKILFAMVNYNINLGKFGLFFHLFAFLLLELVAKEDIEIALAEINSKGFPSSLLYKVAGDDNINELELAKRLESPVLRKALLEEAMKHIDENLDKNLKEKYKKRKRGWDDYCDYSWIRWLSFMDCKKLPDSEENEIGSNFQVLENKKNICYKKKISK